jgi:hypothetical protein
MGDISGWGCPKPGEKINTPRIIICAAADIKTYSDNPAVQDDGWLRK